MTAYYNENDPKMAAWLDALIDEGEIAYGVVDTRSIWDVRPSDLIGFTQCHFFAGVGVWSRALREAGWPDDRPVWTGSAPCQPFSQAGKGIGFVDERHLWPAWFHLIQVRQPCDVFGEQVNSPDGRAWLDLVSTDLDHAGYTFGAVGLVSCGFGSPDIRERNYFVASLSLSSRLGDADNSGLEGRTNAAQRANQRSAGSSGVARRLAESNSERWQRREGSSERRLCDGPDAGWIEGEHGAVSDRQTRFGGDGLGRPGPTNGFWRDADWILCNDPDGPRWRPVEAGTFPLAHGSPARMGRLRGYGNAINLQVAKGFISAFLASEAAGFVVPSDDPDEDVG